MSAAKVALIEHAGISDEAAQKVVRAIVADKIPNVGLRFTI